MPSFFLEAKTGVSFGDSLKFEEVFGSIGGSGQFGVRADQQEPPQPPPPPPPMDPMQSKRRRRLIKGRRGVSSLKEAMDYTNDFIEIVGEPEHGMCTPDGCDFGLEELADAFEAQSNYSTSFSGVESVHAATQQVAANLEKQIGRKINRP
jgi:hypothetical protein